MTIIYNISDQSLRRSLLLRFLQLDGTIPVVCGSSYAVKLSPHSKCYNTPPSMRVVIDSGRYLCMIILLIKRRDLNDYKEIITYRSAVAEIQNTRCILTASQIFIHLLHREGGSLLITTENTTHKYFLFFSTNDTYSYARRSSIGTASMLLT